MQNSPKVVSAKFLKMARDNAQQVKSNESRREAQLEWLLEELDDETARLENLIRETENQEV